MSEAIAASFSHATPPAGEPGSRPVRVWPAIAIVALIWGVLVLLPRLFPDSTMIAFLGAMWGTMLGCVLFAVWWVFFSRVTWADVGLTLLITAIGMAAILFLGHISVGFLVVLFHTAPWLVTAWTAWLVVTRSFPWQFRRAGLCVVILAVCSAFLAIRFDGTNGEFAAKFSPRWTITEEDRFLAERESLKRVAPALVPAEGLNAGPGDWLEFRGGVERNGVFRGQSFATDWQTSPPKLLWKHRVGPGWSSFAVVGDRVFTQEQRGSNESVVCYDAATGQEIWAHDDPVRFWEAVAGAGPRATPTFRDGKIYAQGATGKLNCLDARTGTALWSRDLKSDVPGLEVPQWGFSASPLVSQGIVTVFGGGDSQAVLAYDANSGSPLWKRGNGKFSYCSTQLAKLAGVEQILIATEIGVVSLDPRSGDELWTYPWPLPNGLARVTQPNVISDSDFVIGTGFDNGTRRVRVSRDGGAWTTKDVWNSRAINPYYNDFVVHGDHLYGFDGKFFTCVDLNDGKKKWRERGYGNGQTLLLADQGVLLILTESGEIALVEASPDGHNELTRIPGIDGKTWNHPVIAHGRLLIRNGQEAACFELTTKSQSQ